MQHCYFSTSQSLLQIFSFLLILSPKLANSDQCKPTTFTIECCTEIQIKNTATPITPPSKNPDWYKIYMGNQQYNDAIALALAETFKSKNISFDADY